MKKLLFNFKTQIVFLLMLLLNYPLFAQVDTPTDETNWIIIVIAGIVAVLEVVLRMIPNKNLTGIFGLIINALKMLSDFLNNRGKET